MSASSHLLSLQPSPCPASFWHLTSALHCGLLPNMAVRAVFLKAEAIPQCLRLPTALGTKSRLLKLPARWPALAFGLRPSSPEPPYAAPLGLIVSLGRKLWGGPPGSTGPPVLSRQAVRSSPVDPAHPWCCLSRKPWGEAPHSSQGVPGLHCRSCSNIWTGFRTCLCVPWLP